MSRSFLKRLPSRTRHVVSSLLPQSGPSRPLLHVRHGSTSAILYSLYAVVPVGFWASPAELLEFYDTPNVHQAFSFLDRFLAESFIYISPSLCCPPKHAVSQEHAVRPRAECAVRPSVLSTQAVRPTYAARPEVCWKVTSSFVTPLTPVPCPVHQMTSVPW